jgi:hypothetical protein
VPINDELTDLIGVKEYKRSSDSLKVGDSSSCSLGRMIVESYELVAVLKVDSKGISIGSRQELEGLYRYWMN